MKFIGQTTPYWLATLALGALMTPAIAPARAQSSNPMPPTAVPQGQQDQDVDRNINRDAPRDADRDDLSRRQLANFDQFLDRHPELAEQIRKDPSLINNRAFVDNHSDLQTYLQEHPEIRQDLNQNPNAVLHQEQRYDRAEGQDRDGNRDGDRDNRGINRTELANLDRFMDSHPEIAEQLRKDPSLADNKQFVENHPALREFLADHPGVREQLKTDPNAFMHREDRFDQNADRREDRRDDITRRDVANMDRFLDGHPEIAQQLRKNPSLIDNKEFVENHPALREFLADHTQVRDAFKDNPTAFMRQENRYDRREDSTLRRDGDVTGGELSSFHEFLEGHGNVSAELSKNPSLATNQEYLENHPELREYLQSNPKVHEELTENPQQFLKSAQQFANPSKGLPKPIAEPKVK